MIPPSFKKNSTLEVVLAWYSSAETNCTFSINYNAIGRARPGAVASVTTEGVTFLDASTYLLPVGATAAQAGESVWYVDPGGGYTDQLAGDSIQLGFFRLGGDAADTCTGDLRIVGIEIRDRPRR